MGSKEVGRKTEKKSATGLGGKKLQTHFLTRVLGEISFQGWGFRDSETKQVAAGGVRREQRQIGYIEKFAMVIECD